MKLPADPRDSRARAPYDRIAEQWTRRRLRPGGRERALVGRLIDLLPAAGHVLDLGCGHGRPIVRRLLDAGLRVTGVDLSVALLAQARLFCPEADLVAADLRTLPVVARFDGAVAWDSIFHLPRAEHGELFQALYGRLRPGAPALISLGGSDAEFTAPMFELDFFYSGFAPEQSMQLIRQAGFEILHHEIDDPRSRGHLALLCRKEAGT